MASAKKVPISQPQYEIILSLTPEEAEVLLCITQKISGSPWTSHRGKADDIANALIKEGVRYNSFNSSGNINFPDYNSSVKF